MPHVDIDISEERKRLIHQGELPEWFITPGWKTFKNKYLYESVGIRGHFERIADTLSQYMVGKEDVWYERFYDLLWSGDYSASSPVLANTGTDRGFTVSCAGNVLGDSVDDFYQSQHEIAMLSKMGFGTSSYMGDIRARGSTFGTDGVCDGVWPQIRAHNQVAKDISQGSTRRGQWAGYLPISHGDFWEVAKNIHNNPGYNIGWVISKDDIDKLKIGEEETTKRWQQVLYTRTHKGKGYIFKVDHANDQRPQMYVDKGLYVKASQLCTEISLFSDLEHTYSCVLGSLNLNNWDRIRGTNKIFYATVMTDCIVSDFLKRSEGCPGFEKIRRFTEKSRALGIGVLGWHSWLIKNKIPFYTLRAHMENNAIFEEIQRETLKASKWLAKEKGEPEWCKGYGVRNTHRTAIAPTKTSSLICGGQTEGIQPMLGNIYSDDLAGGSVTRIQPHLIEILKQKGKYNKTYTRKIVEDRGSVQNNDLFSQSEKDLLRTAYEIPQDVILNMASSRQKYLCQTQSLNLHFFGDADPEYISRIHSKALLDPRIISLYYQRSTQASVGSTDLDACDACQ